MVDVKEVKPMAITEWVEIIYKCKLWNMKSRVYDKVYWIKLSLIIMEDQPNQGVYLQADHIIKLLLYVRKFLF